MMKLCVYCLSSEYLKVCMYVCMYVCTPTILPMPARPKYVYVHNVCTVCMYVCICGNLSNVLWLSALLLNAGCDRTLKDNNGLTARDHASRHSFTVMIQFISQSMVRWPTTRTTVLRLYDCIYLWMNVCMYVCMYACILSKNTDDCIILCICIYACMY